MQLQNSIGILIERLEKAGFDLQADEIADILWLASKISVVSEGPEISNKTQKEGGASKNKVLTENHELNENLFKDSLSTPTISHQTSITPTARGIGSSKVTDQDAKAALTVDDRQPSKGALTYRAPVAGALPGKLAYSRALRPLIRRIPSLYDFVLDEDATVQRIADDGIWSPVLRPALTRWLELDVVVDEASSMEISFPLVEELLKLLETLAAFKSIQVWGMITESVTDDLGLASQHIRLHPGFGLNSDVTHQDRHPKELISNPGQGLVIVISDCVDSGWYDGLVGSLIAIWGEQNTVLLLQTLPPDLWDRTGLVNAIPLQLSYPKPGDSNQRLEVYFAKKYQEWAKKIQTKALDNKALPSFIYLPIAALSPESLSHWAKAIVGNTMLHTQGYWLPTDDKMEQRRQSINRDLGRRSLSQMSERERLQRFFAIASPVAQRLAGFMAAIPLSLPVMHLVQRALLPESGPEHMAEFFLGGLLTRRSGMNRQENANPLQIQYEFRDTDSNFDIRLELLRRLRLDEIQQIWLPVASYIEQHFDKAEEFEALVADPAFARPFALVGLDGLRSRGGKYATFADEIERQIKQTGHQVFQSQGSMVVGGSVEDNIYAGKKCFVIMPFGKKKDIDGYEVDFDRVYHELIYKVVKDLGVDCERVDEIIGTGSIHKKMFRGIFDADVAVVDITSLNPNIFYELGVRHALHKYVTLVIRRNSDLPIPFNISGLSILGYDIDSEDQLESNRKKIRDYIRKGLAAASIDSIVYDALDDLKVVKRPRTIEVKRVNTYQIAGVSGIQIGIITGNILNIKEADVWVVSQNTNMEMPQMYERTVNAIVRYAAAEKDGNGFVVNDLITKDVRKVTRGRDSSPGYIVVTTSGELERSNNVKRIFHAASMIGEPGSGYRLINNIAICVRNALRKADSEELAPLELNSILFPLMEADTTRSSAQEVADQLIDAALEYVKQNPESRINQIYFLAFTEQDLECWRHKLISDPRIQTSS